MCQVGSFAEHMLVTENARQGRARPSVARRRARVVRCRHRLRLGGPPAEVEPGDTVAVIGIGGIGINAVQGAKIAGAKRIIAVDPVEFKREKAMEFGATHTFASMEEATASLGEITWGEMANKVILTPGVMRATWCSRRST